VQGKLDTEAYLEKQGVNYTSIRPVYIYGEGPLAVGAFHVGKYGYNCFPEERPMSCAPAIAQAP
jgi:hypothetical protein